MSLNDEEETTASLRQRDFHGWFRVSKHVWIGIPRRRKSCWATSQHAEWIEASSKWIGRFSSESVEIWVDPYNQFDCLPPIRDE